MIRRIVPALLLGIAVLLITGCSGKNYFEPEETQGAVRYDGELPGRIVEAGYAAATLDNGQVITKEGLQSYRLPEGYYYVAGSGTKVVAAGDCKPGIVYDIDTNETVKIDLPRRIVAAMFIPDSTKIAFLVEGNSYGIYDYGEGKIVAKYDSDPAITADIRIANPIMLEKLVLIPTLDGKLIILSKETGEKVREIVVGSGEEFNNVIFLKVIGNRLVAATPHRIVSVSPKIMDAQQMEIGGVIFIDDAIYILGKEGTIYHCDVDLKILHTKKFPFAHFVGAIYGDYIYVVEREGFIIAIDPILSYANVFELPDRIDDWLFTTPDAFFYQKYYFKLQQSAETEYESEEKIAQPEGEESTETEKSAKEGGGAAEKEEDSWFSDIWKALKKMGEPDESKDTVEGEE